MKNCSICNSPNSDEARFCEKCGAPFEQNAVEEKEEMPVQESVAEEVKSEPAPQTTESASQTAEPVSQAAEPAQQTTEPAVQATAQDAQFDSNGVSEAEFSAFIGKNQNRFIPDFRKFCNGKKVSFSPLVFLLSFLVSPIAGAFWFFHRKMNKVGSIVLAIALALTVLSGVVGVCMTNDIIDETSNFVGKNYGQFSITPNAKSDFDFDFDDYDYDDNYDFDDYDFDDNYNFEDDYDEYSDDYNYYSNGDSLVGEADYAKAVVRIAFKYLPMLMLLGLLNIAMSIVLGLVAKYLYFKFAANSILKIKQNNPTPTYMNNIAAAGGTSCVIWVICTVVLVIATIIFASFLAYSIVSKFMYLV